MPGGFVALGAVSNMFTGGANATKGWITDEDDKWQDTINFLRIIPMVGDSIVRMGIYAGLGDNINRRNYRGVTGSSGGGNRRARESVAGHYGIAYKDMHNSYESLLGDLVSELSPRQSLKWSDYQNRKQLGNLLPMAGQPKKSPDLPTQAPRPPVQAPVPKDTVGAILEQKPAEAPSGLLKEN